MSKKEVMQLALDALVSQKIESMTEAIHALRAELAKPAPEPVAAISPNNHVLVFDAFNIGLSQTYAANNWTRLYRKEDV